MMLIDTQETILELSMPADVYYGMPSGARTPGAAIVFSVEDRRYAASLRSCAPGPTRETVRRYAAVCCSAHIVRSSSRSRSVRRFEPTTSPLRV